MSERAGFTLFLLDQNLSPSGLRRYGAPVTKAMTGRGAYLVKCCGGVFDDPQTGQFYDDHNHLENEIKAIIADLLEQGNTGELLTHEFMGWT